MKIIVPMAGRGSRLRPHTLTIPKPLIPIAGKPIVQRLVEDIASVCVERITEIAFIIGDFGSEIEQELLNIAKKLGSKGTIYHQKEALGTAHAILCAKESLQGPVIVAFADTLFRAEFNLDTSKDGIVWVQKVENPNAYGVVKISQNGVITDFIEKPTELVSSLAIIGVYFFKDGIRLRKELQYLIDNNIKEKGEFQLTNALENLKNDGAKFYPGKVLEWLDCGNPSAAIYANKRILEYTENNEPRAGLILEKSSVVEPCYIGSNVKISNSTIGPHVSIGNNCIIKKSKISNSLIQDNSTFYKADLKKSMIGSWVDYTGNSKQISVGDYSKIV
jgi:glucose-1-phosphate thymidylyltransferase